MFYTMVQAIAQGITDIWFQACVSVHSDLDCRLTLATDASISAQSMLIAQGIVLVGGLVLVLLALGIIARIVRMVRELCAS